MTPKIPQNDLPGEPEPLPQEEGREIRNLLTPPLLLGMHPRGYGPSADSGKFLSNYESHSHSAPATSEQHIRPEALDPVLC